MSIDLPPELVHKILVHAAQSSASSCRALCKVSTWVRHLALPLLYITVPAHIIGTIILLRPVCSPSPGFKPAEAMRNVWALYGDIKWIDIMQHCTGLSHIASTHENLVRLVDEKECFSSLENTPLGAGDLHVLMLNNPSWMDHNTDWSLHRSSSDKSHHFFRRITHLRLEDPADLEVGMRLNHMSRLTHLAIPFSDSEEDLKHTFEEYLKGILDVLERTSVRIFVIVLSHEDLPEDKCRDIEKWVCEMHDEGASGVYVVRPLCGDLQEEWDAEVRGGVTIWERAVEYTQLLVNRIRSRIDLTTPVALPHEILCSILLHAAESSTSSCRALCEVSIWVRYLALPLLYRTIAISNTTRLGVFARLITSALLTCPPSPTFRPADAVHHLWVPFASEILGSVVRQCDNVTHLAIHHHDLLRLPDVTVPSSHERPNCPNAKTHAGNGDLHIFVLDNQKRQYSRLPSYNSVRTRALFSRITHLRLGDMLGAYSQVPIRYMPRLTHVAVPYFDDDEGDLDDVVSDVFTDTSVEILVLVLVHENLCKMECRMVAGWVCEHRKEDTRVYVVMQLYSKLEMEWEAEVRGEVTIWERAVDYTQLLMDQWSRIPEAPTMANDAARPYLDTDSYIGTTGT